MDIFFSNAGGGGERVLWTAVAFLQRTEQNVISVIYSGDQGVSKGDIIDKVKVSFSVGAVFLPLDTIVRHALTFRSIRVPCTLFS